jgi:methylenetetrahydrofolate dehydrogenase (NADP+)/methenyltetrahydrofolate cyclohydrolase
VSTFETRIASDVISLPSGTTEESLLELISALNQDHTTHGILVQLPLPDGLAPQRVLDALDPFKDVDAFHPENVGLIVQGRPRFLPCTPLGVIRLLLHAEIRTEGKHVVIVGRSDIVGKPLAVMLVQKSSPFGAAMANATVTLCHSRSRDLQALTCQADILVVAAGVPRMIGAEMVRAGAAVIDVGINRIDGQLVGDVDFPSVVAVAGALTPVPGGVGPMTIAMLLHNTLQAARYRQP